MSESKEIASIKERITKTHGIYFGRIPTREWQWFMQYAGEEWAGDYGIAFAAIIKGYMPPDNVIIAQTLEVHESRIADIESRLRSLEQSENKESGRKMLGGRSIN